MEVLIRIRLFGSTYFKYLTYLKVKNRWYVKYILFGIIKKKIFRLLIFLFSVSYPSVYRHFTCLIYQSSLQFSATRFKRTSPFLYPHFVKNVSVDWLDSLSLPFRIFWIACTTIALASSWHDVKDVLFPPPLDFGVRIVTRPSGFGYNTIVVYSHRNKQKSNHTIACISH